MSNGGPPLSSTMNPVAYPATNVPPAIDHDLEKNVDVEKSADELDFEETASFSLPVPTPALPVPTAFQKWNAKIESLAGLEARGIVRVQEDERHDLTWRNGYLQMAVMWYSANVTANNLAVGFLGPLLFGLGFTDSSLTACFGCVVGSAITAYMSIWGAQSGNRTMIVARYFMGYWPSKLTCVLNMIIMVGYGTISCIIAGQILSAVSDGSLTIIVGIVITALISWLVAVFGMGLFQIYERWAWVPQTIVLFILIGVSSHNFDTALTSTGTPAAILAARLSFFSLSLSVPVSWAGAGSDFYVYYPVNTSKCLAFLMTFIGLTLSFCFVNMIGIGLATGVTTTPAWQTAYATSSGALILAGYGSLGSFGKFCGVVVALGVISNNVPSTYAAALGCQVLGRYGKVVPRYIWVCFIVLIYFVCAVAGRNSLFAIFQNFLALMGYWICIFVTIVLQEHVLFKNALLGPLGLPTRRLPLGFDWTLWEQPRHLPVGIAALIAFLIGWAGAIIGMYQVWYIGPVAKLVGDTGADIGVWLGIGFAGVTYPGLRWLEIRKLGR